MTTFEQRLKDTLSHSYEIERELGGGGMSRVFVATERSLGRKVVIKLLSPELTADVNRGRFRREIQVAARLQHPHIVALLSAGEYEDLVYYTMPFIAGESLRSAVEQHGPMSITEVVRVLYHVGEALDYAHREGVVHRDIKPANILRSGTYFLVTDFGVAKALNAAMPSSAMTSTGMAVGTPAYMAPEQLAGDSAADHRIDIYAVGLLAYELLKGRSPFAATTPQKVLAAVLTQDPPPLVEVRPDVPRSLSEIVMSCLSKEPDERPASARDLLAALDTFSTASGEIRTEEHQIPRMESRVRTPVPAVVTAGVDIAPLAEPTTGDGAPVAERTTPLSGIQYVGYDPPPKSRKPIIAGAFALILPLAAWAIFLSQREPDETPAAAAGVIDTGMVAESAMVASAAAAAAGAGPDSLAATSSAPRVDSQRIRDSLRVRDSVRRARAEERKRLAARSDSLTKAQAQQPMRTPKADARRAAAAMFANATARDLFMKGASRKGGPLGTRRRGDLQTQIDALTPFLTTAGLTYEQFKSIVAQTGVNMFDEFGRMVPDSLQRFANATN